MHWWSFLDLHLKKKKYFYSTALDLVVLKNFYYKMIKKLSIKFSKALKNLKKRQQSNGNNFNLFLWKSIKK